ncbi:MAG: 3-methyl-2-oxobutanoate hydroxymethyltransferase [Candidatus Heimdallarchaeota archaeon]
MEKMTTTKVLQSKGKQKLTMLTAYDYLMAKLFDSAGIDILLVGDSMGHVVYGYGSTIPVTLKQTINHCKAVTAGAKTYSLIVGDMPFLSYGVSLEKTVENAGRIMKESNVEAVKLEGGSARSNEIEACIEIGIPVMGHLGLTPQSVNKFGGYKVQGKSIEMAEHLISEAEALTNAGCFSIVLEAVPWQVAKIITETISVPTIGIGAGPYCDAQVLVWPDALGLFDDFIPKFVKQFANVKEVMLEGLKNFKSEIKNGTFPDKVTHSYQFPENELKAWSRWKD